MPGRDKVEKLKKTIKQELESCDVGLVGALDEKFKSLAYSYGSSLLKEVYTEVLVQQDLGIMLESIQHYSEREGLFAADLIANVLNQYDNNKLAKIGNHIVGFIPWCWGCIQDKLDNETKNVLLREPEEESKQKRASSPSCVARLFSERKVPRMVEMARIYPVNKP